MKSTTLNLTWEHERVMNLALRNSARSTVRDSLWVSRMSPTRLEDPVGRAVTVVPTPRRGRWAQSAEGLAYGALALSSAGMLMAALAQTLIIVS